MNDTLRALLREPVLIVNVVKAFLVFLVAFGVPIAAGQQDAILSLVQALIAVVVIFAGAAVTRSLVTPVAAPKLPVGTPVETTEGAAGVVAFRAAVTQLPKAAPPQP